MSLDISGVAIDVAAAVEQMAGRGGGQRRGAQVWRQQCSVTSQELDIIDSKEYRQKLTSTYMGAVSRIRSRHILPLWANIQVAAASVL